MAVILIVAGDIVAPDTAVAGIVKKELVDWESILQENGIHGV